jgi:hypothetical protein
MISVERSKHRPLWIIPDRGLSNSHNKSYDTAMVARRWHTDD